MDSTVPVGLVLGTRHDADHDHITPRGDRSRRRPRETNGLYFTLGQGLVATLLAVWIREAPTGPEEFFGPGLIVAIKVMTLWMLCRSSPILSTAVWPFVAPLFFWGLIFGANFEAAFEFGTFTLSGLTNLLVGVALGVVMVLVDGFDGYFVATAQNPAKRGRPNAQKLSPAFRLLVVLLSFGSGGTQFVDLELRRFVPPIGLALIAIAIGPGVWARNGARIVEMLLSGGSRNFPAKENCYAE